MTAAVPRFGMAAGAPRRSRAISFFAGLAANATLVAVLVILRFPAVIPRAITATVVLIAPAPATPRRAPPPSASIAPVKHSRPLTAVVRPHPRLIAPPSLPPPRLMAAAPSVPRNAPFQPPPPARPAPAPPRPVITGAFAGTMLANARLSPPAARVEAGAFPGSAGNAPRTETRAPVQAGSFLAYGGAPGAASGHGDRRVIADAFGSARSGAPSARAPAAVIPAAFDSAIAAPQAHRLDPAPSVIANAVRIVAKPKPQYTEEARRLRIEGEVWLDVLFGADGAVRVRGVVRSLGHGLDEAAIAAAREIRFHPANDGHADVDQIATIRVQFLLAD